MKKIHELKTINPYYNDVVSGVKKFDVRKDDRNFQVGDILVLREYDSLLVREIDPEKGYTGHATLFICVYKLCGENFGIKNGYAVLGIESIIPEADLAGDEFSLNAVEKLKHIRGLKFTHKYYSKGEYMHYENGEWLTEDGFPFMEGYPANANPCFQNGWTLYDEREIEKTSWV